MKKFLVFFINLIVVFYFIFLPQSYFGSVFNLSAIQIYGTESKKSNTKLENPLGNIDSPQKLIGKIISSLLGIVGSIALAMFIYGGLRWMTAAGGSEGVKTGMETMKWAVLGLVVIFTAYALVNFVIKSIGG